MGRKSAQVYDLIYEASGKDYEAEATGIREQVEAHRPGARSLLDVACGTGAHLAHLRRWYDVVGIDLDPAMLEMARRRLPDDVALVEADMRSFDLGRTFDGVICLFSAIGYMSTIDELDTAVAAMARHLSPGGVLVVDGWVRPDRWRGEGSTNIETASAEDIEVARCVRTRREGNTTLLEMHHLIATVDGIDHVVDHHALTLFESSEYEDAFTRAGFAVEVRPSPMRDRDRYVGVKVSEPAPRSRRAGDG